MQTCPECRALVHEQAPVCPACDRRLRPRSVAWTWLALGVLAAIGAAAAWLLLR